MVATALSGWTVRLAARSGSPRRERVPDLNASPLRALILSASFGSGHHQANEAVGQAMMDARPGTQVRQSDFLNHITPLERMVVLGFYLGWLRYSPAIYRQYYQFTDKESGPRAIRDTYFWMGRRSLRRELNEYLPDTVVSSYPTPAAVAGHIRDRSGPPFMNTLIVTDYRIHQHWVRFETDLLLVATPEAAEQMVSRGIQADRVVVSGIPIHARYRALMGANKAALRLKHGLAPELPLLLISGGGQGLYRSLEKVVNALGQLGRRVQVLVLAGADQVGIRQQGGATVHRLGFTTDFPELLAAADLVVGKAGGLTVAEATTLSVPLVIYDPIPGQEEYNAQYLVSKGAAIWGKELHRLRPAVLRALDEGEHARLSAAAKAMGVPDAAERAARAILERL